MSPIAIHEKAAPAPTTFDVAALKAKVAGATTSTNSRQPLPVWEDAVAPDYMYKFKYNHELPLHGREGLEIPLDENASAVATELLGKLSQALHKQDTEAFADLFLEHGIWRDRVVFTWDYRTFNFRDNILKAASALLPRTPVSGVTLIDPPPNIERPYNDLSFIQCHIKFDTDKVGASALCNIIHTPVGYRIWTLNTVIESLHGFPEIPERDGHMTGPQSWPARRAMDNEMVEHEPEVLIIGGGQNGLMTAARLKALGVNALIIERNSRIGDNWRGRYEALSLHLPHWGDHFAYMPYPNHWPMYCPAAKLADWFEWYVSAMELNVWTGSSVSNCRQDENGDWTVEVDRSGKGKRVFHPKQLIMATSLAGVPYSPSIPGRDTFNGVVRHSTEHDSSREWIGKRVLVVGTSSSGFDTAYDFARRGVDVTILQRSPTYIMSLTHSVPRVMGLYKPVNGKRPDVEVADRLAYGMPVGPGEEMGRRLGVELTELDYDLLQALEDRGFKTWRGQRATSTQTLGYTKNGGFYFDAGACEQIINGNIKVEQGWIDHFKGDMVVLNGGREQQYDLVILATGFSNTIDSVRRTLGDDVADRHKPIWGMDEEGELNSAWRDAGIPNYWLMVGTLQAARYHSAKVALRIKARLEGIEGERYLGFISSGVLKACSTITGKLGWQIPYILQWVWPVPLALGCFFAPESAWWLTRHERYEDAERTIVRCAKPGFYAEREAAGFVAFMRHTDALEKIEAANGSWKEMFMGVNLRRTEIMMGVWMVQLWNGNIITGLTVEMLEDAGMSVAGAFNMNLVLSAMSIIGVAISWVALSRIGRRHIYIAGIVLEACCLLPIGILGSIPQTPTRLNAMGGLMIAINLLFHFSLGPVCYSIVGELPASRLRSRSIVLGRFVYLVSAIIGTQLRARMIAADSWNWQEKSAYFWLGCNLICLTWTFFRLPETGGFSFAELDILFANKVPTRKFKQYKIKDEVAEIGVDLSEKQNIEHMEDVNVELMDETEREEVAAQEPVPGARPNVLV